MSFVPHTFTLKLDDGYSTHDGYSPTALDGYTTSASFNSWPVELSEGVSITVYAPSTGSPVGTLKLQGCNESGSFTVGKPPSSATWFDVSTANFCSADSSVSVTASGITQAYNLKDLPCKWIRLVYTRTSGSITVTAKATKRG